MPRERGLAGLLFGLGRRRQGDRHTPIGDLVSRLLQTRYGDEPGPFGPETEPDQPPPPPADLDQPGPFVPPPSGGLPNPMVPGGPGEPPEVPAYPGPPVLFPPGPPPAPQPGRDYDIRARPRSRPPAPQGLSTRRAGAPTPDALRTQFPGLPGVSGAVLGSLSWAEPAPEPTTPKRVPRRRIEPPVRRRRMPLPRRGLPLPRWPIFIPVPFPGDRPI